MKRILTVMLALLAAAVCLTAAADHSVLPRPGDMDETQAVDRAVALFCAGSGADEAEIRGHWYYSAIYYETLYSDEEPPVWWVRLVDPQPDGAEADGRTLRHPSWVYVIRAGDGERLPWEAFAGDSGETGGKADGFAYDNREDVWEDTSEPGAWNFLPVPTKEQLQPAEALDRARELLAECLGPEESVDPWRDYWLQAATDGGRYRILVTLGRGRIDPDGPLSWNVWLDADTGEVIWQSDPARFRGRYAVWKETGSWTNWYAEREQAREEAWGEQDTWTCEQMAAFEEECFGRPYWPGPERFYALPGEGDISPEQACAAAEAWFAAEHGDSAEWAVTGFCFVDDRNGWLHPESETIPPQHTRYWYVNILCEDPSLRFISVMVDAQTGEVLGDLAG